MSLNANERIKRLREHLGISQEKLGETIGLSKSGISSIENGNRSVTEKHIKLISTCFNVNENWLRTGAGDMFNPMSEDEELDLYIGRISGSDDNFKKNLLKALCKLTEDEWDVLKKIISEMKEG
ncbi:XRE family transcriptional regulator [bacterium C-53]|nr:XRE family transcriptional regulator [Lachnospiraceae bacterium]NBI03874.1 XRE family transcriptional regulator [Lachnospiraceae bacterium]RKJ09018.1 XRE family transcriptional regulator [bacterium C-53]